MTTERRDPIDARRAEGAPPASLSRPVIRTGLSYAQDLADAYNRAKLREDCWWIVDSIGELKLVDDASITAQRSKAAAARREAERQRHLQRTGHLTAPAAPHWQDETDEQ